MSAPTSSLRKFANFRVLKESQSNRQMICFPFVGGNANSFLEFAKRISIDMEILAFTPPGHFGSSANLVKDLEVLVDICLNQPAGFFKERFVILGYSMGSLLAYRLTQKLLDAGKQLPELLILSATTTPEDFKNRKEGSQASDEDFIRFLDELGGLEPVVKENPDILGYYLPILRAEFQMIQHNQIKKERLPVPAAIISGTEDSIVAKNKDDWKDYFSSQINFYAISGGHMFIKTNLETYCKLVMMTLTDFGFISA